MDVKLVFPVRSVHRKRATLDLLNLGSPPMMELGVTPDVFLPFYGQPSTPPVPGPAPAPAPSPAPGLAPLRPGQGGVRKVCRTEEAGPSPFPGLPAGVLEMRVKEGSKIRNLMGFALARLQGGAEGGAGLRQVVFSGSGRAVTKTITCAEIMKRKVPGLHQLTKLRHRAVREVWGGGEGAGGAGDALQTTVHRTVPSVSILLSKDPLDPREPGYQAPEAPGTLWGGGEGVGKRPPSAPPSLGPPDPKRPCLEREGPSPPPS